MLSEGYLHLGSYEDPLRLLFRKQQPSESDACVNRDTFKEGEHPISLKPSQMESEPYCSRHFLGTQANVLRSLPFAPPGNPDRDGNTRRHRLLALADWHEDSQVSRL